MADGMSIALARAVLDCVVNNVAFDATWKSAITYVSLHTAEATSGNELTGNNYSRAVINANGGSSPTWDLAGTVSTEEVVDNTHLVSFPTPSGNWSTVTHFAVHKHATNWAPLFRGTLTTSRTPLSGDPVEIPIGELDLKITTTGA